MNQGGAGFESVFVATYSLFNFIRVDEYWCKFVSEVLMEFCSESIKLLLVGIIFFIAASNLLPVIGLFRDFVFPRSILLAGGYLRICPFLLYS